MFDCPADENWSVKYDRCDYPEIADCKIDGTHQFKLQKRIKPKQANDNNEDSDQSSSDDIDDNDSFGEFEVDPRCVGSDPFTPIHFSHPTECAKYYKCYMGKAFVIKCPKGQHWGQRLNRCDHPSLAHCTSIKHAASFNDDEEREKMNSITHDADYIIRDERCDENIEDIDRSHPIQFAHPSDCQMFYKCFESFAYKVNCPEGLHFNVKKQECDYAHVAECNSSVEPQNRA